MMASTNRGSPAHGDLTQRSLMSEGIGRPPDPPWAHPPPQAGDDKADADDDRDGPDPAGSNSGAAVPRRWRLVEIKDGVQVAEHNVQRRNSSASTATILGRAEGAVDVPLRHESVSRFHARIAFDADGTAWLRDYGSAHGTYVNKKRVPPEASGKGESSSSAKGSRGVVLRPGDVLQLGASTRLLLFEGPTPEQVKQVVMEARRRRHRQQSQPSEKVQQSETKERDNNAGSDGEDEAETARLPEDILSLTEDEIPPAHRKLFEKIRALHQKIENMTIEVERIQRKGDVGLSAGQEKQIQRNEERIAQLQAELETRSDELWQHLRSQRQSSSKSSKDRQRRRASDDAAQDNHEEDEVEDRTVDRNAALVEFDEGGETEASLLQKYNVLVERSRQVESDLVQWEQRVQAGMDRVDRLNEQGNFEDAFYATNDLDLAKEQLQKVKRDKDSVSAALKDVRRMLKVVKPTWNDDTEEKKGGNETASWGRNVMPPPSLPLPPAPPLQSDCSQEFGSPPVRPSSSSQQDTPTEFVVPMPPAVARATSSDNPKTNHQQSLLPPPALAPSSKRRRVIGPSLPSQKSTNQQDSGNRASSSLNEGSQDLTDPGGKPATKQSARSSRATSSSISGTLSFLSSGDSHAGASSGEARRSKSGPKPTPTSAPSQAPANNDPQQDVWQPPKDQDGSGSTKLNAKFAGRY